MYHLYETLIEKPKKYERVTRKKMVEEILKVYTPEMIINICDKKELEFLQLNINKKKINYLQYKNREYKNLYRKLILTIDGVFEELRPSVEKALNSVDWDKKEKQDTIYATLLGYLRVMGSTLLNPLQTLTELFFGYEVRSLF